MEPFELESQAARKQALAPFNALKTGVSLAAGAGIVNKIAPFLSKFLPENLAIKGLNKLDSRFGKFINNCLKNGYNFDEVRDFIGDKVSEEEEPAKQNGNIIQQYSPELNQFMDQEIKKGRKPIEAGAIAQNDKRFSNIIEKLSKDHKTPWSSIIESIFGKGDTGMSRDEAFKKFNEKKKGGLANELIDQFEQGYGQQPTQISPAQQSLIQAIQLAQQLRNKPR